MSAAILSSLGLGYLLGSIPFGLLLTRAAGLGDVRAIGSGSIGATNVLRTGRKGLAVSTMLLDALKGTAAVLIAAPYLGTDAGLAAGLGAFLGHLFPIWLGFRGGKGVATFLGILLAVDPGVVGAFALVWLAVAFASRYSSLSSLTASTLTPGILWWLGQRNAAALFAILAIMVWIAHRSNIRRLLAGTEGRIGQKG